MTRTRILDSVDLTGPSLPAMVRGAMAFIDGHFARRTVIAGLTHQLQRPVPLAAVREALVNAAVHADYSQRGGPIRVALFNDRLEIETPGLLPFGLAVEDLSTGVSRVRNKVIARTFKELGFIEQWGSDIGRILDEITAAGLAAPTFEEIGERFRVTFTTTEVDQPKLSADHQTILRTLGTAGRVGMSPATSQRPSAGLPGRRAPEWPNSSPSALSTKSVQARPIPNGTTSPPPSRTGPNELAANPAGSDAHREGRRRAPGSFQPGLHDDRVPSTSSHGCKPIRLQRSAPRWPDGVAALIEPSAGPGEWAGRFRKLRTRFDSPSPRSTLTRT